MAKRGNSNTQERKDLIERFVRFFGLERIKCLTADREFIGKEWFEYLSNKGIIFYIRIRNNSKTNRNTRVDTLFRFLNMGQFYIFPRKRRIFSHRLNIVGMKLKGDYLIIVTNGDPSYAIESYEKRWEIETLFGAFKSRGFNFEDTHLTKKDRVEKLVALMAIAFCWAHLIGEWLNEIKSLKVKNHGRLEKSIFRYGYDHLRSILLNIHYKFNEFDDMLSFLSCT